MASLSSNLIEAKIDRCKPSFLFSKNRKSLPWLNHFSSASIKGLHLSILITPSNFSTILRSSAIQHPTGITPENTAKEILQNQQEPKDLKGRCCQKMSLNSRISPAYSLIGVSISASSIVLFEVLQPFFNSLRCTNSLE